MILDYTIFPAQPRPLVFIPPARVRRRLQSEYQFGPHPSFVSPIIRPRKLKPSDPSFPHTSSIQDLVLPNYSFLCSVQRNPRPVSDIVGKLRLLLVRLNISYLHPIPQ